MMRWPYSTPILEKSFARSPLASSRSRPAPPLRGAAGGRCHARARGTRGLRRADRDPVPTDLLRVSAPAHEGARAVLAPAPDVSGAVEAIRPGAGGHRLDEGLGGALGE